MPTFIMAGAAAGLLSRSISSIAHLRLSRRLPVAVRLRNDEQASCPLVARRVCNLTSVARESVRIVRLRIGRADPAAPGVGAHPVADEIVEGLERGGGAVIGFGRGGAEE